MTTLPTQAPVAVVTGAGSGIGQAIAVLLARSGYRLVIVGRRAEPLEATNDLLVEDSECECVTADVSDPGAAGEIVRGAIDRFGRLDVVVNNAGVAPLVPIDHHTPALLEQIYRTNAIGPACLIASAWAVFKQQHATGRSGPLGACIVNVSTLGTRDPFPGFFGYAASKASLNLMTRSCANEGREIGVRAYAVAPGAVETQMLRTLFKPEVLPENQCLTPERVAEEVVACILGERTQHNGQVIFMSATAGVFTG